MKTIAYEQRQNLRARQRNSDTALRSKSTQESPHARRFDLTSSWIGMLAGLIVLLTTCISGWALYLQSVEALREEVRANLVRTATTVAAVVNVEEHQSFVNEEQESTKLYTRAVEPLARVRKASGDIKSVYTCIFTHGMVRFVLDSSAPGQTNGIDNQSHIMLPYDHTTPAIIQALSTGKPSVSEEPAEGKFGTIFSGFAPFFDSSGHEAGIVGVDLAADQYIARIARIRAALASGLYVGVLLSLAVSLCVFFTLRIAQAAQKRGKEALQRANDELEKRVIDRTADLAEANQSLNHAYETTIVGWSRALDLRDHETEGHSQRVTDLTLQVAAKLGFSESEQLYLRHGALLHDIGKMGVPDNILLKPGALTEDEWTIMRQHPALAYEMLLPIEFLHPALDIPYCHHEKWDGSGYPRGLQGGEIPLGARIFAIIDVWDALRSKRPYRDAWPEDRVCEHIRAQSGAHFDPDLVETFLEMVSSRPNSFSIRSSQRHLKAA